MLNVLSWRDYYSEIFLGLLKVALVSYSCLSAVVKNEAAAAELFF